MKRALTALLISTLILSVVPQQTLAAQDADAPSIIRGSIQDANGQPMTGYRVTVTDAEGKVYQSEPTGADGKFEISGLPAGTYTYAILDPQGNPISVKMPPVTLEAGTVVTRPIAIVPRAKDKGPMVAWIVGGAVVVIALALAGGTDNVDNGGDHHMSNTSIRPSVAP